MFKYYVTLCYLALSILTFLPGTMNTHNQSQIRLYPALRDYSQRAIKGFNTISEERKQVLEDLAESILEDLRTSGTCNLLFICTHNSRRSHMSQIWASTAAYYFQISGINFYSGGTEVTAFNPRAVAALSRAGFDIGSEGDENPIYTVRYSEEHTALRCYSKKFDDQGNPRDNFIAIMTCSDADQNCPIVMGAKNRFLVSYEDPKAADNTPEEQQRYDERSLQIASEMFFLMSLIDAAG